MCAICKTRRPRRYCPGIGGEICAICCGTEREVTISCPFDCVYLREARRHEKAAFPENLPNSDIEVSEKFVEQNERLLSAVASTVFRAAMAASGAVDFDVREALEGLIRTYRTLRSGIYFESRPTNPLAAAIYNAVEETVAGFRRAEQEQTGVSHTRDADVLAVLVFLQRYEYARNNGRRKGRAFLDALREFYPEFSGGEPAPSSSLILP